jgi:hypothetical protein
VVFPEPGVRSSTRDRLDEEGSAVPDPVITCNVTIMDGQVVRWHRDTRAAENHRPALSASRNGVAVHETYLSDIPTDWLDAARAAYEELAGDRNADLRRLATHRVENLGAGPLVPIAPGEAG